jgi:hypothetical protein
MNLQSFTTNVPESAAELLAEFETHFTYPLGNACRFRISHGNDYLRFFRSMGEATLLVASDGTTIHGSIARVEKELILRRKSSPLVGLCLAHYLCDLKVKPASRGSMVLPRLIKETKRQIESSGTRACYSVVMDGTGRLPTDYTGRLGVPKFERLAKISILRLTAHDHAQPTTTCRIVSPEEYAKLAESIYPSGYAASNRNAQHRSSMEPVYFSTNNGDACGILQDTRRAKQLFLESGEELLSGHLCGLRYQTADAGATLLREAARLAHASGFPAVFTSVPHGQWTDLQPFLEDHHVTVAPATIYGHALQAGCDWWIDTAEI